MSDEEEPQVIVTNPLTPAELGALGPVLHPDDLQPQPAVPIEESISYSIVTNPPEGTVVGFSDDEGRQTPDHYHGARFFLGPDGAGTFTFMPSTTQISVEGSGTRTADEDRVAFANEPRGLSGVFTFPRGGQRGEVTLTHGSVHLKAAAVQGIAID